MRAAIGDGEESAAHVDDDDGFVLKIVGQARARRAVGHAADS